MMVRIPTPIPRVVGQSVPEEGSAGCVGAGVLVEQTQLL